MTSQLALRYGSDEKKVSVFPGYPYAIDFVTLMLGQEKFQNILDMILSNVHYKRFTILG